ncbi:aldo/keto reductase [Bacillus sp. NP157]|nr:aldo/keto reductase [Bacillus sp. NP157]
MLEILRSPLGFGSAPIGNMFENIPDAEAQRTIDAAWDDGIRYFDTAPLYGAGLAELRLGAALKHRNRGEYVVSSKVGRLVMDEMEDVDARDLGEKAGVFRHGRPNRIVTDYSERATFQSVEDSLERLGTDYLDIVWVHDVAQDFFGDEWIGRFEEARTGAFRALERLKAMGTVRAWGLGVNRVEPIELLMGLKGPRPDGFLLAGRYTLLDHALALQRVMPLAAERGLGIVVGGPYSSGVLVGGATYEYAPAPPEILARVARIREVADEHSVDVKTAALWFGLYHPAVVSVIPGSSSAAQIASNRHAFEREVPPGFWRDLRANGLISPGAPVPLE